MIKYMLEQLYADRRFAPKITASQDVLVIYTHSEGRTFFQVYEYNDQPHNL